VIPVGSLAIPTYRLSLILENATPELIYPTEVGDSICIVQVRSLAIPDDCLTSAPMGLIEAFA
jgi:hypothetical protein